MEPVHGDKAAVIIAFLAFLGVCVQSLQAWRGRRETKETHREVAVNGGKNNPPTLKDKVGYVVEEQAAIRTLLTSLASDIGKIADGQAEVVEGQRQATQRQDLANERMDAHLAQSAQMDARLISLETEFMGFRQSRQ
ncbi:hypothetical protein GCM10028801_30590 [Nocardioides maradonensis]